MEIKKKLGDKIKVGKELEEIMGGKTMEFYSISFKYIGKTGVTQIQTFRKSTDEELEE